jgi:hypothetical protein
MPCIPTVAAQQPYYGNEPYYGSSAAPQPYHGNEPYYGGNTAPQPYSGNQPYDGNSAGQPAAPNPNNCGTPDAPNPCYHGSAERPLRCSARTRRYADAVHTSCGNARARPIGGSATFALKLPHGAPAVPGEPWCERHLRRFRDGQQKAGLRRPRPGPGL